ncbi:hypothetical protein SAMN05444266_112132 [Chitinophaga jiangningensis]|uniref:Uncharacterized protein n=1 Tax=Chitinophaga jiangningensis TaxID=1419482 RepID=A0A1M7M8S0_9BACT|nr:hypothetical protein SAMN05444266_112132 [Chitinophaga jiangningensis]
MHAESQGHITRCQYYNADSGKKLKIFIYAGLAQM